MIPLIIAFSVGFLCATAVWALAQRPAGSHLEVEDWDD